MPNKRLLIALGIIVFLSIFASFWFSSGFAGDGPGVRSNGTLWLQFGPAIFKTCKRIDWYRGRSPKKSQSQPNAGWVEMDLSTVNKLTLKESDKNFSQTLEFIRGNFESRFNSSPNAPSYRQVDAADGALILYSSDAEFPPEKWFCEPHLVDTRSGDRMYPDVLLVIPLTAETLGCSGDMYKQQLTQLEGLMQNKTVESLKSVEEIEKTKRVEAMKKEMNQTYGFIDKKGKMVFSAGSADNLDWRFRDGLLKVKDHGIRFWNKEGKPAFAGVFDDALEYSEGMSAVRIGKKWGFIDQNGQQVVAPAFENARSFKEGLAPVCTGGRWGYVDKQGKLAIAATFDYGIAFSEGLAAVEKDGKIGFVSTSGQLTIKPQFDQAGSFSEGLAEVISFEGPKKNHHMWFIDKTGKVVIDCNQIESKFDAKYEAESGPIKSFGGFRDIFVGQTPREGSKDPSEFYENGTYEFHDGLCPLTFGHGDGDDSTLATAYIDKTGAIAIGAKFDHGEQFDHGLALVMMHNHNAPPDEVHTYGFINKKGDFVIAPKLFHAEPFSEGLAVSAVRGGQSGFIDEKGNWAIPASFLDPKPFSDGLARVGATIDLDMIK